MENIEYSASEVRKILQQLFPQRRLVLSQFTFFNQIGIAKPSGETTRRGRRCYRLEDMLPIATVLALKEEGIPFKNIEAAPELIQNAAPKIFEHGSGCRLSGRGEKLLLQLPGHTKNENTPLEDLMQNPESSLLFWSFDIGLLAEQLTTVVTGYNAEQIRRAA